MTLQVLGEIEQLLALCESGVMREEHLTLVRTKVDRLKEQIAKLESDNSRLQTRNAELEAHVAPQVESSDLVESNGALFKRLPSGDYAETPFCPKCQKSMWAFQAMFSYECSDELCGHKADFKGEDLDRIIAGLAP